jgi:hypothetical protein
MANRGRRPFKLLTIIGRGSSIGNRASAPIGSSSDQNPARVYSRVEWSGVVVVSSSPVGKCRTVGCNFAGDCA